MKTIDNDIRTLKGKQSEIISKGKKFNKDTGQLVTDKRELAELKAEKKLVIGKEDLVELASIRTELNSKKSEKRLSLNKAREEKRRAEVEAKEKAQAKKNILTKIFKSKKAKK